MFKKDKQSNLSNQSFEHEERLAEEFAQHLEDEENIAQMSGVKKQSNHNAEDALKTVNYEYKIVKKRQKWGWILIVVLVLFLQVESLIEMVLPPSLVPYYIFISSFVLVIIIFLIARYLFPSFASKLFRE